MALVQFRGFQTNRLNCEHFQRNISGHIWTIDFVMISHSEDKEMQTLIVTTYVRFFFALGNKDNKLKSPLLCTSKIEDGPL